MVEVPGPDWIGGDFLLGRGGTTPGGGDFTPLGWRPGGAFTPLGATPGGEPGGSLYPLD